MIHKAKKSLGQNFLKSTPALNMMCEAGQVGSGDIILEIGPGKGALTEKLLGKAHKVIAVEKDRDLIDILKEKFVSEIKSGKLILLESDILQLDLNKMEIKNKSYKLIANIPYNITGSIIRKFLTEKNQPQIMTLLVQKEVAMRIVAQNKKESILSLSVKAYGTPKYIMKVGKRFFSPSPKVDSAIIAINNISRENFDTLEDENNFFDLVKIAFLHKRKILKKNLEALAPRDILDDIYEKLNISPKTRAEDLPLHIWLSINRYLPTLNSK